AIILALIALYIGVESVVRILNPVAIHFNEAIPIAVLGLGVNLVSAWLLADDHHHDDENETDGAHDHHIHRDHNIRAAYLHVLADARASILAIIGLLAARLYGWVWMDPMMGIIGAGVIAAWSWSLIRSSGAVLLDMVPHPKLVSMVKERLEVQGDKV